MAALGDARKALIDVWSWDVEALDLVEPVGNWLARANAAQRRIFALRREALVEARHKLTAVARRMPNLDVQDWQATRLGDARYRRDRYVRDTYGVSFAYLWPKVRMAVGDGDQDESKGLPRSVADAAATVDFAALLLVLGLTVPAAWLPVVLLYTDSVAAFRDVLRAADPQRDGVRRNRPDDGRPLPSLHLPAAWPGRPADPVSRARNLVATRESGLVRRQYRPGLQAPVRGGRMKLLLWFLYGALLAAGAALMLAWQAVPPVRFEAAVDLPTGHRLAPGDIQLPGGEHYLQRRVPAGGTVTADDLATRPYRGLPHGMTPMTVALAPGAHPDLLQSWRAGWLCPALPETGMVRVLTLICAQDNATCLAVVAIPRNLGREAASTPRRLSETRCR
jgi:hypothetical protein